MAYDGFISYSHNADGKLAPGWPAVALAAGGLLGPGPGVKAEAAY